MLQKVFDAVKGREADHGPLFTAADNQSTRRAKAWLAAQIKRGQHEVFGVSCELTPELAELLLGGNPDNRHVSRRTVQTYARDIENGAWDLNGQSIVVATDGYMNDGQHRCHAVIAAGRSIPCMFVFGVERKTRLTLDAGRARLVGDYLQMDGHVNASQVAAIARLVWQYDSLGRMALGPELQPTKQQVLEFAVTHPGLNESATFCSSGYSKVIRSLATFAACHYIFRQIERQQADEFMSGLMTGDGLAKHTAAHTTRERLITEKMAKRRISSPAYAAIIIHGWNAYRQKRRIQRINVQGPFPEAI